MAWYQTRRQWLRDLGVSLGALPFITNLASVARGDGVAAGRKQRLVVIFSPNGVVPWTFWPDAEGDDFELKESLRPLEPFRDRLLVAKGICNKVRGAGSAHMVGIGCLLTGVELLPGDQQGGSGPPAGWGGGISIDQEIANYLQSRPETQTRFGSLEYGVMVPDEATVWTRMSYRGSNDPVRPIDDPYQMLRKFYGRQQDQRIIGSILDHVLDDLHHLRAQVGREDRQLLDRHASIIRQTEREIREAETKVIDRTKRPDVKLGVDPEDIPTISKLQIDLLVHGFEADFNRIATLQFSRATSGQRLTWLGIDESHHTLSHEPDEKEDVQQQLTRINHWYCEQLAYLVQKLAETPEPHGEGSLLDNTLVVWTNELGKGNNHTRNDLPFVMVGGGLDFRMGRSLQLGQVYHNRLLMSLAHGFGHEITQFGDPNFCADGPLSI